MAPENTVRWLVGRLRPHARVLGLSIAAALAAGLIATVDPLLIRYWLDVVLKQQEPMSKVLIASLFMSVLIALTLIGRAAINGTASLLSFRISQMLGRDLRAELLRHMTTLSIDWHEQTLVGEKLSRFEQDVEQIAQFSADALGTILRSVIFFFVNLGMMFVLNWHIALTVLPLLPSFLWVRSRFRKRIQQRADRTQTEVGRSTGIVAQHLGAVPQIQILGAEEDSISRALGMREEMLSAQWSQRRAEVSFTVAITGIMAISIICVLGPGTYEYLNGVLSIGGLMAFYTCVTRVFDPISSAMELYSRSQRMMASTHRVRAVLATEPSVKDQGHLTRIPTPLLHGIACRSVSFSYNKGLSILHDVSFNVGPGERVALVGGSGSGKSSLARLLARMADPTSGIVTFETERAMDYTLRTLRQAICYVPQHPVLFSGTIRDNLLYADPAASNVAIERVIDAAQLRSVVQRLPQGVDTLLGAEAAGLSGGERQRLAIARALLRNSAILILDESTSALDMPTESAVLRSIADVNSDQAIVIISHRLRALTWVDRVILLDAGRIIAQGTHSNLYRDCRLYRNLYEKGEGDHPPPTIRQNDAISHPHP